MGAKGIYHAQECHIVNLIPPVSLAATTTSNKFNMKNWRHASIILQLAHELTGERFADVPRRLRAALGSLVNAPVDEIVLANSASYGLHLIANSYPWRAGDEILVMAGDFPSDILPWLMIARRCGVCVIRIKPRNHVVAPDKRKAPTPPLPGLFVTQWFPSFRVLQTAWRRWARSAGRGMLH